MSSVDRGDWATSSLASSLLRQNAPHSKPQHGPLAWTPPPPPLPARRPDWNAATLLRRDEPAPGVAVVALAVEVSRERVPLRNAYVAAGQLARVRVNGGEERLLPVASAPPGAAANSEALFFTRGDIFAGDTKSVREPSSAEVRVRGGGGGVLLCCRLARGWRRGSGL